MNKYKLLLVALVATILTSCDSYKAKKEQDKQNRKDAHMNRLRKEYLKKDTLTPRVNAYTGEIELVNQHGKVLNRVNIEEMDDLIYKHGK